MRCESKNDYKPKVVFKKKNLSQVEIQVGREESRVIFKRTFTNTPIPAEYFSFCVDKIAFLEKMLLGGKGFPYKLLIDKLLIDKTISKYRTYVTVRVSVL